MCHRQSWDRIVPAEGPLWNWSSLGGQSLLRLFCQRQTVVSLWRLWGLSCSIIINPGEAPSRYSHYSLLKIRRGSGSQLHYRFSDSQSWNHLNYLIWLLTKLAYYTDVGQQSSRVRSDCKWALSRRSSTFTMPRRRMWSGSQLAAVCLCACVKGPRLPCPRRLMTKPGQLVI